MDVDDDSRHPFLVNVPEDHTQLNDPLRQAAAALSRSQEAISNLRTTELTVTQWQETCATVGNLLAEFDRAANEVNAMFGLTSPQERVLRYLLDHVGEVVGRHELRGVAAIYEWARRIRELRIDHGWPISSNNHRPDLRPGQYILEATEPNDELLQDWTLAKRTRDLGVSAKNRGLEYLKALSPRPATKDQLAYVMKTQSYTGRLQELDEEGWEIRSSFDDPALPPGSYRLISLELRPPRMRDAIRLRYQILERDSYACQDCLRAAVDNRIRIEVHRIIPAEQGGANEPANLVTLCSNCHAERHGVVEGTTDDELRSPRSEPPNVVR